MPLKAPLRVTLEKRLLKLALFLGSFRCTRALELLRCFDACVVLTRNGARLGQAPLYEVRIYLLRIFP